MKCSTRSRLGPAAGLAVWAAGLATVLGLPGTAAPEAAADSARHVVGAGAAALVATAAAGQVKVPGERDWAEASVAALADNEADIASGPVALPGTSYAYAVTIASGFGWPPTGRLSRVNLETGRLSGGPRLLAASQMLVVGRAVGVISPTSIGANGVPKGPYWLRLIAGQSTRFGKAVKLAWREENAIQPSNAAALTHGGIWLPTPSGAQLVSTTSGKILRALDLGTGVSDVVESPDGKLVFASLDELTRNPASKISTVIVEVDAATGRVAAHTDLDGTLGWTVLTPVPDGVWASFRTGMAGSTVLFRSAGPALIRQPTTTGKAFPAIPRYGSGQMMGVWAYAVGPTLLLVSDSGASCVMPSTGKFLAGVAFSRSTRRGPASWTPFAMWKGLVYATSSAGHVIAVRVPHVCLHPQG